MLVYSDKVSVVVEVVVAIQAVVVVVEMQQPRTLHSSFMFYFTAASLLLQLYFMTSHFASLVSRTLRVQDAVMKGRVVQAHLGTAGYGMQQAVPSISQAAPAKYSDQLRFIDSAEGRDSKKKGRKNYKRIAKTFAIRSTFR